MTTIQDDAGATGTTASDTHASEFSIVVLTLRSGTVSFNARHVSSIPDPDGLFRHEDPVFLTAKGNVAIHDTRARTLAVHSLDEFIDRFADSPVNWIVDEVLAALPYPVEHLDI